MKEYIYQKMYFEETFKQYPTMTYNQILLSLIEKYNVKKIEYNNKNFSVFKNSLKKAQYTNLKIDEKLDNIKLLGKKLMVCKLEYVDYKDKETEKKF